MKKLCIVSPNYQAYSETFIHNHIKYLPGEKLVIYNLGNDAHFEDGTTLLNMGMLPRLYRMVERRRLKITIKEQEVEKLVVFLRKRNIDFLLAEYGLTGAILASACRRHGIPLVVHFHGYDAYNHEILEEYEDRYAEMFAYAKNIIAVSEDMVKQLIKIGAPPAKVHLNPYGIDLSQFQCNNEKKREPIFIAVGRFVEKKAPFLTILAFKKVIDEIPEAKLIMVGTGPLEFTCKQLAKSLAITASISFKSVLNNVEVSKLMQIALAFVQHSVTTNTGDAEGTPLSVLEACASGIPVVSTKHGGINDAIIHNETGYLVEEGDIEGMAHYMIKIAKDPMLAYYLGQQGRQRMQEDYNLQERIMKLWEIIQK